MTDLIDKFKEIQALLLNEVPLDFVRPIYNKVNWESRLIGVVGPRGVGKTTLLLQHLKSLKAQIDYALYLSADLVLLGSSSLFELAKTFHLQRAGKLLLIDEVHRFKDWSSEIKAIYDSLPKLKVVFSGSSQVNITKGRADLARRAEIYTMPGLSFREYLEIGQHIKIPPISMEDLTQRAQDISGSLSKNDGLLLHFAKYLTHGYYPYYLESAQPAYFSKILNSIDKAIFEDIALVANLQTENLVVFKELLAFFSSISPGEINIHKIAKNIGKKDDTIKSYLQLLQNASLLRFLSNSLAGHAKLKSAEKIFFENTNSLSAFCYFTGKPAEIGLIRETFAVQQLQNAGHIPLYSRNGDLSVGDKVFEIGGKSKGSSQLGNSPNGYVLSDDILIAYDRKIPLYLLGFLY